LWRLESSDEEEFVLVGVRRLRQEERGDEGEFVVEGDQETAAV
jgi:hypothetical protein